MVDIGGVIRCSTSTDPFAFTVHVHILGVKTGFENGVGWGKDKKMRLIALIPGPYRFKAELS